MKSFLDRFRRKEGDEEPSAAPAPPVSSAPKSPKPGDPDFDKHNQTLDIEEAEDVSGFNPDLVDSSAARRASAGGNGAAESSADDDLVLELGDFLHRIPHQLLKGGAHDTQLPLHFDLGEVADRVARGETTIPLTELYRRVPQIFQNEILPSDNVDIRFPWQKVIQMINASAAASHGAAAGVTESLAHRLRSRRGVARNIGNGQPADARATSGAKQPAAKQVSWFKRPGATDSPLGPKPAGAPLVPASPTPAGLQTTLPARAPEARVAASMPAAKHSEPVPATSKPLAAGLPKEVDLTIPPIVDDPRLSREEILRAREAAVLQLARVRGEYERQIALLHQERKTAFDHRDRAVCELEFQRKEIEEKLDQLEFDKSLVSKASEKTTRERELFQEEINVLKRERELLVAEVESLKEAKSLPPAAPAVLTEGVADGQEADIESYRQRIKVLLQERDSAVKEREDLARKLSEVPVEGAAKSPDKTQKITLAAGIAERDRKISVAEQRAKALEEQNAALLKEKIEALAAIEELKKAPATSETGKTENGASVGVLRTENERLSNERNAAHAEAEKLRAEVEAIKEHRRREQEKPAEEGTRPARAGSAGVEKGTGRAPHPGRSASDRIGRRAKGMRPAQDGS